MVWIPDEDVIQIFEELPSQTGCQDAVLDYVEGQLDVVLPPVYRRLMKHCRRRLVTSGICLGPEQLVDETLGMNNDLEAESFHYRMPSRHIILRFDPFGSSFWFCESFGLDNVPVFNFNLDGANDEQPVECCESVSRFFAEEIRRYLKL